MKIKVMTWNIWHGKYLPEIIDFLQAEMPDVLGLQEINEQLTGEEKINTAKLIAEALDYQYIYCKTFTSDRHTPPYDIGNAILSKYPINNPQCEFLSSLESYQGSADTEPRGVITADINIKGEILHIANTHLGFSKDFVVTEIRKIQLGKLLSLLQDKKMVLMGDFNSVPDSEIIKRVETHLTNTDSNPTLPTVSAYPYSHKEFVLNGLDYRIDYIFTSKDVKVLSTKLGDTKASDHLPVLSELKI